MTDDKRSPLHDCHEAHGAETIWEDGYPWTMHEGGDPMKEYEARPHRHRHLGSVLDLQVRGHRARTRRG